MSVILLMVEWGEGLPDDPQLVTWKVAPWLPTLLCTDNVTIGRTVRSRQSFDQTPLPTRRHEMRHVAQQAGTFVPWWLLRYVVWPPFRNRVEADARAQEDPSVVYPTFKIIGSSP